MGVSVLVIALTTHWLFVRLVPRRGRSLVDGNRFANDQPLKSVLGVDRLQDGIALLSKP